MEFCRARSLDEALDLLAERGDDAKVLAGGTDVMVQYLHGEISPPALVHIEDISGLAEMTVNGATTVGPLATHRAVATHPDVARSHPALAAAARTVGGWQTQAVGTIGGNICNASPAADTVPPLLIANARVTLTASTGDRVVPLADFFVDRRHTVREPSELLTAVDLEPLTEGAAEVYLKLGRRGAMEVALVGIAMRLGFSEDGTVTDARVAVNSLAPTPFRVPAAESLLTGSRLENDALDAAAEALRAAASPISDARSSASYRLRTLRGLVARAAHQCREAVA